MSSRLRVGPNVFVTQGTPLALDTAHTGAVIALDSSAASYASAIAALRAQRRRRRARGRCAARRIAARARARARGPARAPPHRSPSRAPRRVARSASSRSSPSRATPCRSNRATAASSPRRVAWAPGASCSSATTKRGAGGSRARGDAPAAHRDYWSAVVSAAAYRADEAHRGRARRTMPRRSRRSTRTSARRALRTRRRLRHRARGLRWWMFALLALLLLAEWASRRLRGAR